MVKHRITEYNTTEYDEENMDHGAVVSLAAELHWGLKTEVTLEEYQEEEAEQRRQRMSQQEERTQRENALIREEIKEQEEFEDWITRNFDTPQTKEEEENQQIQEEIRKQEEWK